MKVNNLRRHVNGRGTINAMKMAISVTNRRKTWKKNRSKHVCNMVGLSSSRRREAAVGQRRADNSIGDALKSAQRESFSEQSFRKGPTTYKAVVESHDCYVAGITAGSACLRAGLKGLYGV